MMGADQTAMLDVSQNSLHTFCEAFLLVLVLAGCAGPEKGKSKTASSPGMVFFVATNGNDRWSGKLPFPNRNSTDGPFGSVDRAIAAVRETKSEATRSSDSATIYLRAGYYFLS